MSALARIKKTAAQHEQERQYDKALALYARLLDGADAGDEEVDVGLFNRAGDLALRLGDAPRAVGYFERALDLYAAGGLLNNAVALGVKILRHAPNHLSAHYTLGVLYGRKGFAGDARHHLLTYAVQMQRAGRADEAGRVLAEVATGCGDAAAMRAALDTYGALGGDLAQAAALAADGGVGARPPATPAGSASRVPAAAHVELLDLGSSSGGQAPHAAAPAVRPHPDSGAPAADAEWESVPVGTIEPLDPAPDAEAWSALDLDHAGEFGPTLVPVMWSPPARMSTSTARSGLPRRRDRRSCSSTWLTRGRPRTRRLRRGTRWTRRARRRHTTRRPTAARSVPTRVSWRRQLAAGPSRSPGTRPRFGSATSPM
jgi:hypothetical protein